MKYTPRLEAILQELNLSIQSFRMIYCSIQASCSTTRFGALAEVVAEEDTELVAEVVALKVVGAFYIRPLTGSLV